MTVLCEVQHVTTVAVSSYLAVLDVQAKKLLPVFDVRFHIFPIAPTSASPLPAAAA